MTDSETKKERVRAFWDAMNKRYLESQLDLLSDDAVFEVTGTTPVSGANEGKAAVKSHFERFGELVQPGVSMDVTELICEGNTVVCLSQGVMTARTGRRYNNCYAFVFKFEDDVIRSVTEYLDTVLVETALFSKSVS